jgi:2-polyprenyl-3-methyl-5-hydroxy-6-metoxy-1,4-benzoquinol methylase
VSNWNIETVERVYAAFRQREFPADQFEETASWHTDPDLPRPMAHHGRDEVAKYFEHWIDPWIALGAEPVELIPRPGEQIVAVVAMGPSDGARATVAHLLELRRRRVVSVRVYGDRQKALAAAGEPAAPRRAGRGLPDRVWTAEREYRGAPDQSVADFVERLDPAREALDLGCGDARVGAILSAAHLTAADVSLVALKRARRRLPNATLVLVEPGARLPFEDEAFDLVVCADTIQEVQDVAQFVAETKRVLRPGGTLALTAPAYARSTGWSVLRHGFREQFDPRAPALRFLTRRSLGDLLDLAGFNPIEIERADGRLLATAHR